MAAHRYWRIKVVETQGDQNWTTATGIEMRDSIGGSNLIGSGTAIGVGGNFDMAFQPYDGDNGWRRDVKATQRVPAWVGYDFGDGNDVDVLEFTITGVWHDYMMPVAFYLDYSDDGAAWTSSLAFTTTGDWVTDGTDTRTFNASNSFTSGMDASALESRAAISKASPANVSQLEALSVINFPAKSIAMSAAEARLPGTVATPVEVSQISVLVIGRGRVANPRLRAWTFTLDGHDFYVLRLGDNTTLVYDLFSQQWAEWSSAEFDFWRANVGINWLGSVGIIDENNLSYGSDVVVGDDTWGLLWFLNADQGYDDHPDAGSPNQILPFERVVMGQAPIRGRDVMPCNVVYLTGDNSGAAGPFGPTVTLYTSDDAGKSFLTQDTINVVPGDYTQEFAWRSLGDITAPGRLFKIVDNGVFARIDSLDMNDESAQ